jgi:hypothetical protein
MIRPKRMGLTVHVAQMEKRNASMIVVGSQKERDHYEDQDIGGWIILKWILERWDGMVWTGSNWLRLETSGGLL